MKLVGGAKVRPGQALRDVSIPYSVILEVARSSLATNSFFPPGLTPAELGDGALIERRNRFLFVVHERFEIGQMRFSEIRTHFYISLRGALRRYLKHYRLELKARQIHIDRWHS